MKKSISQRLRSTKKIEVKKEILKEWFYDWESAQLHILNRASEANTLRDFSSVHDWIRALLILHNMKFSAIDNMSESIFSGIEPNHAHN